MKKAANKNPINISFDDSNISETSDLFWVLLYAFCQLLYIFLFPSVLLMLELIFPATSLKILWNTAKQSAVSEWEVSIS